jgi:hypothetical protein
MTTATQTELALETFPDLDLPDHTGRPRVLSEVAGATRLF